MQKGTGGAVGLPPLQPAKQKITPNPASLPLGMYSHVPNETGGSFRVVKPIHASKEYPYRFSFYISKYRHIVVILNPFPDKVGLFPKEVSGLHITGLCDLRGDGRFMRRDGLYGDLARRLVLQGCKIGLPGIHDLTYDHEAFPLQHVLKLRRDVFQTNSGFGACQ